MKEELDKIEEALGLYDSVDGDEEVDGEIYLRDGSPALILYEALAAFSRLRPRLEKALKLLEQHELLNSLDDGNSGFIQVGDR